MYDVIYPLTLDACPWSVLEKCSERYGKESTLNNPNYWTFMVHSHKIKDLKFTCVFLFQGQYRRLDRFQEDVFAVLEKAREISRSDSEVSWQ